MRLDKRIKLLVAAGTAWTIVYPLCFIALWLILFSGAISTGRPDLPFTIFPLLNLLFPVHCLTIVIEISLMGYYLYHIIKNTAVSDALRVTFGIGTFFIPYIAMPIYYYFFIWRGTPPTWSASKELKGISSSEGRLSPESLPPVRKNSGLSRKKKVILGGLAGTVILVLVAAVFAFAWMVNDFNRTLEQTFLATPTPTHYQNLLLYTATERAFYYPVEQSSFQPVSTFKSIFTWSDYGHIPILLSGNDVFITGYFQKQSDYSWGNINVDLVSADIRTGKVNWQATAGDAMLLADSKHLYATAPDIMDIPPPGPGIVAYDIRSGNIAWKTRFDYIDSVGIEGFALTPDSIVVDTYNHDLHIRYTLDLETGNIREADKNPPLFDTFPAGTYNDLTIEKQDYGTPKRIIARNIRDGSIAWEYNDQQVVSNVAVGGLITYFLTDKNRLIALDTQTGAILGTLAFAPAFAHDFDFVNTPLIVAASGDSVAVYFGDSNQLSVFSFTGTAP